MKVRMIQVSILVIILAMSALLFSLRIKGDPKTIDVPGDYPTIQGAIDAADPGDTIMVSSGTYNEEVNINKAVKVLGSGADTTFVDGTGVVLGSAGLVKITAGTATVKADVTFDGFTVRNTPAAGTTRIGILTKSPGNNSVFTISNNKIYGSNDVNEWDDYGFYSSNCKADVVFTNNLVTQTGANNIVFEVHTGTTEISHNTLDAGVYGTDAIFIMTYGGHDVTALQNVSYNTFDMGTGGPFDYDHRSSAISFNTWPIAPDAKFTNVVIEGNTIDNLESYRRGIGFWNGGGAGGGTTAPIVKDNSITGIAGSNESYGIDFIGADATANAVVSGNTINNCAYGVYLRTAGCAPGAKINYNNIAGNTIGLDNIVGPAIDAKDNWWGHATGPYNPEQNPSGNGDTVSNCIDFEPWLIASYPPAAPVEALLHVDPPTIAHWTVSSGKTFEVTIKIDNVTLLYGYEFKLYWNTTLLDLSAVQITAPWSSYTIGKNETREDLGRYWLAAACVSPSPPFNGSATLARLTFRITFDPVYPENRTCKLDLADTKLSAPIGDPIYHMIHDGTYTIWSTKPSIKTEPSLYAAHALGEIFKINITVSDVVNLYNFTFKLDYNTTLLDALAIEVGSFLNTPTYLNKFIIDDANGEVWLWVWSTDGALPASGSGVLATITFKVTSATLWRKNNPNILSCGLDIHDTLLVTQTGIEVQHEALDGIYCYEPKPGDLDKDGHVGLTDLRTVAYYYDPAYNWIADLNEDNIVDLYDLTIVSYYYGGDC